MKLPFMMTLALRLTLKGTLKVKLNWAVPGKKQTRGLKTY